MQLKLNVKQTVIQLKKTDTLYLAVNYTVSQKKRAKFETV